MKDVTRVVMTPLTDAQKATVQKIKEAGNALIAEIEAMPVKSREAAIAVTNIEQGCMWAVKAATA
jgi:hypothetical protein